MYSNPYPVPDWNEYPENNHPIHYHQFTTHLKNNITQPENFNNKNFKLKHMWNKDFLQDVHCFGPGPLSTRNKRETKRARESLIANCRVRIVTQLSLLDYSHLEKLQTWMGNEDRIHYGISTETGIGTTVISISDRVLISKPHTFPSHPHKGGCPSNIAIPCLLH